MKNFTHKNCAIDRPNLHQRQKLMQTQLQEQLSPVDAEVILERLPERIRIALMTHAAEIEYPMTSGRSKTIEAVVEMAFTSCL